MLRALVALALLAPLALAPTASACCHVREIEESAGPCTARWEGELFWLQSDRVTVSCVLAGDAHGATVENPVPGPREDGFPWP